MRVATVDVVMVRIPYAAQDADPTLGQLREPLVKLFHLMRALEYSPRDDREVDLTDSLYSRIGQAVYRSPTVFSFFTADYAPEGAVNSVGLVAPEAQVKPAAVLRSPVVHAATAMCLLD